MSTVSTRPGVLSSMADGSGVGPVDASACGCNSTDDFCFIESDNLRESEGDIISCALSSQFASIPDYLHQHKGKYEFIEKNIIKSFVRNFGDIVQLHRHLTKVSSTIQAVEDTLHHFQTGLKLVSSEIAEIQSKCSHLNEQLQRRQAAKNEVSKAIDQFIIPERMIAVISSSPVTDQEFIEQLHELGYKVGVLSGAAPLGAVAADQAWDIISKLRVKCLHRLRQFMLDQIRGCKRQVCGLEEVKRVLLTHRYFFEFTTTHDGRIPGEVLLQYTQAASKIYSSHFKSYLERIIDLLKNEDTPVAGDLIAAQRSPTRGHHLFRPFHSANREQFYMLGNRVVVLSLYLEAEPSATVPAIGGHAQLTLEAAMRSLHYQVVVWLVSEHCFLVDFFALKDDHLSTAVNRLLGRCLDLLESTTQELILRSNDCIGLLLCASLFSRYRALARSRSQTFLSGYLEGAFNLAWGRFLEVLTAHIQSLQAVVDPQQCSCDSCHQVTTRVSGLCSAFYAVGGDFEPSELALSLSQLVQEWESFLLLQASIFDSRRHQLIYQIVNYSVVFNLMSAQSPIPVAAADRTLPYLVREGHDLVQEIATCVRHKYEQLISQFSHEELMPFFGSLITFVRQNPNQPPPPGSIEARERDILLISRGFFNDWSQALEVVSNSIKRAFTGQPLQRDVTEACFSSFLEYYRQYTSYVTAHHKALANQLNAKGQMIDLQQIIVEMKRVR